MSQAPRSRTALVLLALAASAAARAGEGGGASTVRLQASPNFMLVLPSVEPDAVGVDLQAYDPLDREWRKCGEFELELLEGWTTGGRAVFHAPVEGSFALRAAARDEVGNTREGGGPETADLVAIYDRTPPVVRVTFPWPGAQVEPGAEVNFAWRTQEAHPLARGAAAIERSTDGGRTWRALTRRTDDTGEFRLAAPATEMAFLLRVTVVDACGNRGRAVSPPVAVRARPHVGSVTPAPVVVKPPRPEPSKPPAPVVEEPPRPEPSKPLAPVVEEPPRPEPSKPPAPVVVQPPRPEPTEPLAPVVEEPPKPEPRRPLAPVVEEPPKPEPRRPLAPVIEEPGLAPPPAPRAADRRPAPPAPKPPRPRVVEVGPERRKLARAAHAKGVRALGEGRLEEAARALREALSADPSREGAWLDLSTALARDGQLAGALAVLERAEALLPGSPELPLKRGLVLVRLSRPGDARAALERAVKLKPSSPEAHWTLSLLAAREDDLDRARIHWREVVKWSPASSSIHRRAKRLLEENE